MDDMAQTLQSTKGSLVQRLGTLVRTHGANSVFTDAAIKEIASIALVPGTRVRGLRSVIKKAMQDLLLEVVAGVTCVITDGTVREERR